MSATRDALAGRKAAAVSPILASEESKVHRPSPFAREADMLLPLAASREQLTQGRRGWETFYEVQTTHGVVDILRLLK
jgi:hypothetical protein